MALKQNICYNVDDLARIISIRSSIPKGTIPAADLIDYLSDDDTATAEAAREALFAKVPMASLQERVKDDSPVVSAGEEIPSWITEACHGWNTPGDFVDICIEKLLRLDSHERRLLFLSRLAAFQGAWRLIRQRLAQRGLKDLAADFSGQVQDLRRKQFPLQLGLSPTMACQLSCEYCISSGVEPKKRNEMPFEEAVKIIKWAEKSGVSRIGLTGGEPTLYSGFKELLKEIKNAGMEFFLATNGLFGQESASAMVEWKPLTVSMHLTGQVMENESMRRVFIKNTAYLRQNRINAVLRVNFTSPDTDLTQYFDTAEQAGIKEIRTAVPMPNFQRKNFYVDKSELFQYGDILGRFTSMGRDRGVRTVLSKPFFPCKMPRQAAMTFFANSSLSVNCPVHINGYSNNMVVLPNGRTIACLGFSRPSKHRILEYESLQYAAGDHRSEIEPLIHKPLLSECANCPLSTGVRCVGACLSYRSGESEGLSQRSGAERGRNG